MYQAIIVVHILLGLGIIGLVLMQQGKGADAGATFGGGASGSVFGAQGAASFLSRTTAILATLFFLTSLSLAWLNSNTKSANTDIMSSVGSDKAVEEVKLPDANAEKAPATATPVIAPATPATETKPAEAQPQQPSATVTTPEQTTPTSEQATDKQEKQPVTEENKTDALEPKKEQSEPKKKDEAVEKSKSQHHDKKSTRHKSTHKQ